MQTPLTELLGCRYPIIQTAMGWVADPTLVAATAKAGGFGFLAGAVMTLDEIEAGILAIKSQTDAPFGVNFHMYVPFAEDIVDLCIEQRVRAVSYSRSPSAKSVEKLKAAGVVCIPTVGAFKHAVKAVELGADALVIQGGEGGGQSRQWALPRRGGGNPRHGWGMEDVGGHAGAWGVFPQTCASMRGSDINMEETSG